MRKGERSQMKRKEMTGISGGRGGKHSGRVGRTGESTKLGVGRKRNIRTHIVLYINNPENYLLVSSDLPSFRSIHNMTAFNLY